MIRVGETTSVQFLQVGREIVNPLGIEELRSALCNAETYFSDDIRRLGESQCLHKLRHGPVKVSLAIQVITVQHVDLCKTSVGHPLRLGQSQRKRVEVTLVQYIQLGSRRVLLEFRQLLSDTTSRFSSPGHCPRRRRLFPTVKRGP